MGVDTRLFISHNWSLEDISHVISRRYSTKVKFKFCDPVADLTWLLFELGGDERQLSVFMDSEIGGFRAISLSMRSNPPANRLLKTLAQTFGGLYQDGDTTDSFEEYQNPGQGEMNWILKEAIKSDPELGKDPKAMADYLLKEGWKK
jgi:hypothetical protein